MNILYAKVLNSNDINYAISPRRVFTKCAMTRELKWYKCSFVLAALVTIVKYLALRPRVGVGFPN